MAVPFWSNATAIEAGAVARTATERGDVSVGGSTLLGDWDSIYLAGLFIPGKCDVGGSVSQRLDVKDAPERDGSSITLLGRQLARVEVTARLWTAEHLAAWEQIVALVQPLHGKRQPDPLDVFYPSLELHGIRSIVVETISLLRETQPGIFEATISAVEWHPPKASPAKNPTGSKSKKGGPAVTFVESTSSVQRVMDLTDLRLPDPAGSSLALDP